MQDERVIGERNLIAVTEPVDGSVVRFIKSGYGYVAVRCGDGWETSSTGSWGFIDESMTWSEMWEKGRYFELATAMEPVKEPPERDKRLVQESVVCFTICGEHWAAIAYQGAYTGFENRNWYTTMTPAARKKADLDSYGPWDEIMCGADDVRVVTSWKVLDPWGESARGWRRQRFTPRRSGR